MTEYFVVDGRKFVPEAVEPPSGIVYVTHNEDRNCNRFGWDVRECASGGDGCPAIMWIHRDPDTFFTRQWQYYLVAINPGMALNNVSNLMSYRSALMNNTGVGNPNEPRRNYIMGEDLDASQDPRQPIFATFSRNTHMAYKMSTDVYKLVTMDGRQEPPLKAGRVYPQKVSEVRLDDYLYTPQTHPHLFLVCNIVQTKPGGTTSVFPFPHGAVYDWFGADPVSFFPLVSRFDAIYLDAENWTELEAGEPVPYPYRRVG